jgi:hypothetical protein
MVANSREYMVTTPVTTLAVPAVQKSMGLILLKWTPCQEIDILSPESRSPESHGIPISAVPESTFPLT